MRAKPKRARPKLKDELEDAPEDVKRLFEALREWRLIYRGDVEASIHDIHRSNFDCARRCAAKDLTQLRTIPGIGAVKAEKFGPEVLAIIRRELGTKSVRRSTRQYRHRLGPRAWWGFILIADCNGYGFCSSM